MSNIRIIHVQRHKDFLVEVIHQETQADDREYIVHWVPDSRLTAVRTEYRSVFRSLHNVQDALNDLESVYREETNNVAGLLSTQHDLFTARTLFFSVQQQAGYVATGSLCGALLYPNLKESVAAALKIGSYNLRKGGSQRAGVLMLHLPLVNGIVKRNFNLVYLLSETEQPATPERIVAADRLTNMIDKILNHGEIIEEIVSRASLEGDKELVVIGAQHLHIGYYGLSATVEVDSNANAVGLYSPALCLDHAGMADSSCIPAKPLKDFYRDARAKHPA